MLQRSSSDARVFSSMQNEQTYPWLYDSVVHQGYLCKFCELFCGHSSSSHKCVTVGINLHPDIWYHDLWSTTVRIRVTFRLRISTSPLFALITCCWMSFEAVLGNKEFELQTNKCIALTIYSQFTSFTR
jgi:hypothetical protein